MKLISVHKSSDTVPYIICICDKFTISDDDTLIISLESGEDIVIQGDNWDWVSEQPITETTINLLQSLEETF